MNAIGSAEIGFAELRWNVDRLEETIGKATKLSEPRRQRLAGELERITHELGFLADFVAANIDVALMHDVKAPGGCLSSQSPAPGIGGPS